MEIHCERFYETGYEPPNAPSVRLLISPSAAVSAKLPAETEADKLASYENAAPMHIF
jgi:hypothetical protein